MNGSAPYLIVYDFFLCAAAIVGNMGRATRDEVVLLLAISLANIALKSYVVFLIFGLTDLNRFFVTFVGASYMFASSDCSAIMI